MKSKSFIGSLIVSFLVIAIGVSVIIGGISLYSIRSISDMATSKYNDAMNDGYKTEIKSEVESVIAVLQYEYDRFKAGTLTEDEAKKEATQTVRAMRYREDNSGYFWIDDTDYTLIMHPILTKDEGKNRYDLEDQNGIMIIQSIMKTVKEDSGGYNEFYFTKSDGVTVAKKLAYSEIFEPWGWVVSTGNYVDDMEVEMEKTHSEISSTFSNLCMNLAVAVVIIIILSLIIAFHFGNKIKKPLFSIKELATRLAAGDLTTPIEVHVQNEFGTTADSLNQAQEKIHNLINSITGVSNDLDNAVNEFSTSFLEMKNFIENVSSSVETISTNSSNQASSTGDATDNINAIASEITNTNNEVNILSSSMKQLGRQSLDTLDELVEVNTKIKQDIDGMYNQTELTNNSVQSIRMAAELINEISDQTGLLSLNASIEAAHAGEMGKGFAVVANEIGSLATQSASAAEKIGQLIDELLSNSDASVNLMENMNVTVEQQVESLNNTQEIFKTLYSNIDNCIESVDSIKKQTAKMNNHQTQITSNLHTLNNLAQNNATSTQSTFSLTAELSSVVSEASDTITTLANDIQVLGENVKKFKL